MAEFIKRGGVLHEIKEGEPLRPTSKTPKMGDQVLDGRDVYQMHADGILSKVQTRNGTNHHFRSSDTSEGGGRPF